MSNFKYQISNADPMPQISPNTQNTLTLYEQEDVGKNLKMLKRKELRIVFFGSRDFVVPVIEEVKDKFNLLAIVTVPDQPVGRGYEMTPTPVKTYFSDSIIPIFDPENLNEPFRVTLKNLEPDLFVVAAYGKLIPEDILDIPKFGALNLHPSLLPKYRGPSPIQNAILKGDKETGMSFMLLDQKMDHGPIIYRSRLDISDQDTFETLGNKLFQLATAEITEIIKDYITEKLQPIEQNQTHATFTKLIKKEDGYFEIENPPSPEILNRMIRAYYPWPNAWTKWKGKIVKFLPEGIQMEGKKAVSLKDFLNGYPDFPLKQLQ